MTVVYMLLPLAVMLVVAFVAMFVWATRDGQFDDVKTPQLRMLFDEDSEPQAKAPGPVASDAEKERS
jgi:cbb3-type cytochrome oxidase maturation protein